jgi:ABC-type lipoprotein export system ATPase subunit
MELFLKLNQQGTTIVQVTHSEENAQYGSRIVTVRDGWVVDDVGTGDAGRGVGGGT